MTTSPVRLHHASVRWSMSVLTLCASAMADPVTQELNPLDAATSINGANDFTTTSQSTFGKKLQDLELKLEDDLHKVERDAKTHVSEKNDKKQHHLSNTKHHHTSSHEHHTNEKHHHKHHAISEAALERVRSDVESLINSVREAQEELGRARAKVDMEEEVIKQKNAEIKTEKIIEELHNGKLNMKVDYVTGKLVTSKDRRSASSLQLANNSNNNSTDTAVQSDGSSMVQATTGGLGSTNDAQNMRSAAAVDSVPVQLQESGQQNIEPALEDIINAAAAILERPSSVLNTPQEDHSSRIASEEETNRVELDPNLKSRVREEIESLRTDADPAVMSMDTQLLLDVVKLAITASLFGLAAVFFKLPPTAGFLLGGMMIGPSCWDIIGEIHQVQTLAQFGSVFLLFEQGLLYSQTYSGAAVLGSALATGRVDEAPPPSSSMSMGKTSGGVSSPSTKSDTNSTMQLRRSTSKGKSAVVSTVSPVRSSSSMSEDNEEHDPNVVGSIILILLIFSTLAIMVFTDVVSSTPEAVFVSCCIAVCSTTIVSENLHAAHIANTHWGKGVLKMIAIQDLFMVPLLALPEIVAPLLDESEDEPDDDKSDIELVSMSRFSLHLFLVTAFLTFTMFFARHVVSAASLAHARMMGEKSELFTLSIVAYALLIATTSEQLKLSIEAGAVLAGIALMKSPHVPKVLASIQPITSVFGGMYLTSLGMILSPHFVLSEAGSIIQLVCLIGLFKLALVSTVLNRFFDYGITASLAVGSAMAQVSETNLLVLAKAQRIGLVSRQTYLLLIPTTCIMLTLAPFSAAQLRRLKMQEVSGHDDGRIPNYLCFLQRLLVTRHTHRSTIPVHAEGQDLKHHP